MAQPTKWKCNVCGYIHEGPEPPATCPVCGVGATMFSPFAEEPVIAQASADAWRCTVCNRATAGDAPPETCPVCGAAASLFVPHTGAVAETAAPAGDHLVVVGGGVAGLSAIEAARRASSELRITLIHKEPDLPYNRLNLTRLLAGEVGEAELSLHPSDWYASHHVDTVAAEVVTVDRAAHQVVLRDNQRLSYDRLLLANGSHPFVPPIAGATRAGVLSLRTIGDARAILDRAKSGSRCVCVGGGLLGLETAGALSRRDVQVTVLEGFQWLLPRQLAEPAACLLEEHIRGLGMEVRCSSRTEEITGDESVRGVSLAGGEELAADLVVLATGVRPNSHLARQSGLEVHSGVVVDDHMQTSDPAIFAAGDVAEHRGVLYGLWTTALGQGSVAGANAVVPGSHTFGGVPPATQLKVLDVDMFSIGEFSPTDGSFRVFEHHEDGKYYRLVCRDGAIVGANLFGDTAAAGTIRAAIEEGRQLDEVRPLLNRFDALAARMSV